jgi:DNA primase
MTKIQLLNRVSQEDIISFYLRQSTGQNFNPEKPENYKSPFSDKDDSPSLSFYTEENKLKEENWKFKSHNTGHQGDVFQFVADLKKIDCKNQFEVLLETISKDLSLNGYAHDLKNPVQLKQTKQENKAENKKISYEKEYTEDFLKYFQSYKINKETLQHFNVQQVKYHEFISKKGKLCKIDYKGAGKVVACYLVNGRIKTYIPAIEGKQEKQFGFKNQIVSDVFGLGQLILSLVSDTAPGSAELEKSPDSANKKPYQLFISAGEKDCLALNSNGFAAVSFQSENTFQSEEQMKQLQEISPEIFICFDNDAPGQKAAEKVCSRFNVKRLLLPAEIKDVADFFRDHSADNFKELLLKPQPAVTDTDDNDDTAAQDFETKDTEQDSYTIFHATEKFLNKNYDLRFNTVKLEVEMSEKRKNEYGSLNENDIFIQLNKKGIKVGMDKLIAILKSSFVKKFNPIHEYFKSLPRWDGKDYIQALCDYIKCDDHEEFSKQFAKWLMRCVRCALVEGYYNKQAFILVHSQQNSGKSTFCRFLVPKALKEYSSENISDDKDSRIALAKNFLINLDELSSLAKHEINSLKSLFSKDLINERLPYDRKTSIIHRISSFIGSTNMAEFLTDETGSVRWLCFEIKSINWKYSQTVDIDKVWSQAFWMIKEGLDSEMTRQDIDKNEERNAKFQQLSSEAEIIPQFIKPGSEKELQAVFLTSTEILMYLSSYTSIRLNRVMVGRAMPLCGFFRQKETKTDRYGYWCIKLK